MISVFGWKVSPTLTSNLLVGMPGAGCQVGVARTSDHRASPVTESLYLSAIVPSFFSNVFQPPMVVGHRQRATSLSPFFANSVIVGRSATGGFHFLCPSLSNFGFARLTSPRSISARSSIFALWYGGSGGSLIATASGRGAGPLPTGLRAFFPGGGAATSVLARTASGDFQPSASLAAWVAGAIRSGAGVILADLSAAGVGVGAALAGAAPAAAGAPGAGAGAAAASLSDCAARGWNSG